MEHRWGKRFDGDVSVTLRLASGEVVPGRMVNVSLSGALIRTQARLPLAGRVAVQIEAREPCEGPSRTVLAHIVRQGWGGAGIEWSDFSPGAICALLAEAGDVPAELLRAKGHARA